MSSLTIPQRWLIPQKFPNEWKFQCSVSLSELVRTNRAATYFRQLVTFLEYDNHLLDYHLKLRQNYTQNNRLDIFIHFGNPSRTSNPLLTPICMSCDPTHELSEASLLSEQQYTRAWLDCRARAKLILTPTRHVERLSELTDENGEMEGFWQDAVELINKEMSQRENYYPTMVLNHGTYRHHAHLHLKINFTDYIWNRTIATRYKEKLDRIEQLLQDSTVIHDCLGEKYLTKKIPYQKSPHKNKNISDQESG